MLFQPRRGQDSSQEHMMEQLAAKLCSTASFACGHANDADPFSWCIAHLVCRFKVWGFDSVLWSVYVKTATTWSTRPCIQAFILLLTGRKGLELAFC